EAATRALGAETLGSAARAAERDAARTAPALPTATEASRPAPRAPSAAPAGQRLEVLALPADQVTGRVVTDAAVTRTAQGAVSEAVRSGSAQEVELARFNESFRGAHLTLPDGTAVFRSAEGRYGAVASHQGTMRLFELDPASGSAVDRLWQQS